MIRAALIVLGLAWLVTAYLVASSGLVRAESHRHDTIEVSP